MCMAEGDINHFVENNYTLNELQFDFFYFRNNGHFASNLFYSVF